MSDIKSFEPLWGAWRTTDLIGEGSFGKVYRAERTDFGKTYYAAIKHISIPANESQKKEALEYGFADGDADLSKYFESITENLMQEIALMYEVKGNTNIVSYEDHITIPKPDGIGCDIFIRMELLTGLNEIIRNRSLPESEVIKLGIDMCSALEICAAKNIIHRDIKPANIFVGANGEYKLGDFGIARRLENTTSGMSKKGTYAYMAPEIYRGEPANLTADIYSLGLVMYRLVNNNRAAFMPPYPAPITSADSEKAILDRISAVPIPPPANASVALSNVILKATQFDIHNRFSSAEELKAALINIQKGISPDLTVTLPVTAPNNVSSPTNNTNQDFSTVVFNQPTNNNRDFSTVVLNQPTNPPAYILHPTPSIAESKNSSNSKTTTLILIAASILAIICVTVLLTISFVSANNDTVSAEPDSPASSYYEDSSPSSDPDDSGDLVNPEEEYNKYNTYCKYFDPSESYTAGESFLLGHMEQDGNISNGEEHIEWDVLTSRGSKVLVISRYALIYKPYHNRSTSITWENCSLRAWLNEDFYEDAFSASEQNYIVLSNIRNDANAVYETRGGNDTSDKIFCLSIDEANEYFEDNYARKCVATDYAVSNCSGDVNLRSERWWLRSPGSDNNRAAYSIPIGAISDGGPEVNDNSVAVRPAFWIEL